MSEVVLFPDVVAYLIGYLKAALDARTEPYCAGVVVDNVEPNPRPARSVVIDRIGGPRLDRTRELARVAVNVWAETDADVTDLMSMVRGLIAACPDGRPVCRAVENAGPVDVPDKQPHRYLVADLTVRGTAA